MSNAATLYYFNIITPSGTVEDVEGMELSSLEAARVKALLDARSLMSDANLRGHDISGQSIEICDQARKVLLTVSFREASSSK